MGTTPNFNISFPDSTSDVEIWTHVENTAYDVDEKLLEVKNSSDGFEGETVNSSTDVTTTGTEAIGVSVTWTAVAARRYKITWSGLCQSTVALDFARIRIRLTAGATATAGGTQLRIKTYQALTANNAADFQIMATVTGISGQYTAGVSIQRVAGSGTMKIPGNGTDDSYILVERIA